MKKSGFVLIGALCLLVLFSCRKDNRKARKMDGEWIVKSVQRGGKVVNDFPSVIEFEGCKVTKEDCSGSWKASDNSSTAFQWQIYSKGEEFAFMFEDATILNAASDSCFYDRFYDSFDFIWELNCGLSNAKLESLFFSGNYKINSWEEDLVVMSSQECSGCYGENITLTLERK